ncbi:hypothetical protein [Helicobacter pylori]|uniref:hypothetical protein n=1 Tax=Helicobacter pylori TaxID=210 RepID=UPI001ABBCA29|nr:hypothetical protein [Helicobacter pylori]
MLGGWALLLLKLFSCEGHANFLDLELKFLECLYFLDIYSIIPNSKDPLKVCILRRLKQLEFWVVFYQ